MVMNWLCDLQAQNHQDFRWRNDVDNERVLMTQARDSNGV